MKETKRTNGTPWGIQIPMGSRYWNSQSLIKRLSTPKIIPQVHVKKINTITDLLVKNVGYLTGLTILKYRFTAMRVNISTATKDREHDKWAVKPHTNCPMILVWSPAISKALNGITVHEKSRSQIARLSTNMLDRVRRRGLRANATVVNKLPAIAMMAIETIISTLKVMGMSDIVSKNEPFRFKALYQSVVTVVNLLKDCRKTACQRPFLAVDITNKKV